MKPIVCITPSLFQGPDKGHQLINMKYAKMVRRAGALPVMCDYPSDPAEVSELLDGCQGLLLTGGYDIDPARYGEERLECTNEPHKDRDDSEFELVRQAVERDMPIFAICRGIQVLNVAFGGMLWQDVKVQGATDFNHAQFETPEKLVHSVKLVEGTPIQAAMGKTEIEVNSCHHQAIKELAPAFEVAGTSPDGIIEAAWMPEKRFVWGVQWHPESLFCTYPEEMALSDAFVAACEK